MSSRKKSKKKNIVPLLVLLIIIAVLVYFWYQKYLEKTSLKISLVNKLTAEINSEVELKKYVKAITNGELLNGSDMVETDKLGKKELSLKIKAKDKEVDYPFEIEVVDTTKPEITASKEISSYVNKDIDLLKDVTVSDNSKEEISAKVTGEYDKTKEGKYELKYEAIDSSGNKAEYDFILNIISDPNNYTFTTSKGFQGKVVDGVTYIDGTLIANKTYALPSNYGKGITSEANSAFSKMKEAAAADGISIWIASGYRSYYDQKYIYNNYVKNDGQAMADTYSARPGHSEHQTGLAMDLNYIDDDFGNTAAGIWLNNNSYKYGFILRYVKGKDDITGYKYEPWHFRYVGTDLAKKLYNDGNWITVEEYYGIDSKYK